MGAERGMTDSVQEVPSHAGWQVHEVVGEVLLHDPFQRAMPKVEVQQLGLEIGDTLLKVDVVRHPEISSGCVRSGVEGESEARATASPADLRAAGSPR